MGSLLHPVGPEQARVYWYRRALVLLVALALVAALLWWLWPKTPGPVSAVPPASGSTPPASDTPAPAPSGSGSPATSTPAVPASSPPTSTAPAAPQACDPGSVQLSVAGFEKVKVSGKQVFALAVANSGKSSCILDLTAKNYSLTVTSGSDRIWTTDHCAKWVPAKKLTLKPETAYEFEISWPLQRSKKDCKLTKDQLKAGTYVAKATFAGKTAKHVMRLVN
ncbi:MAG: hypothetical protein VB093_08715 [Propionicimonas sp.]|nr:hypothetical protein [Propionicimonas sp.]